MCSQPAAGRSLQNEESWNDLCPLERHQEETTRMGISTAIYMSLIHGYLMWMG